MPQFFSDYNPRILGPEQPPDPPAGDVADPCQVACVLARAREVRCVLRNRAVGDPATLSDDVLLEP